MLRSCRFRAGCQCRPFAMQVSCAPICFGRRLKLRHRSSSCTDTRMYTTSSRAACGLKRCRVPHRTGSRHCAGDVDGMGPGKVLTALASTRAVVSQKEGACWDVILRVAWAAAYRDSLRPERCGGGWLQEATWPGHLASTLLCMLTRVCVLCVGRLRMQPTRGYCCMPCVVRCATCTHVCRHRCERERYRSQPSAKNVLQAGGRRGQPVSHQPSLEGRSNSESSGSGGAFALWQGDASHGPRRQRFHQSRPSRKAEWVVVL